MRFKPLQLLVAVICIFSLSILIYSCQKKDSQTTKLTREEELAIAAMKEKIKKEGNGVTTEFNINAPVDVRLLDRNGEFLTEQTIATNALNAVYNCDYPGVVNPYASIPTLTRTFDCGDGYKYTVTYMISAPFNIVATNPYVPTIVTKGVVRLKNANSGDNSSATVVYYEDNIPAAILALGNDPDNPDHFLFSVTFTTGYILPSVVNSGVYIEPRGTFATDCDVYPGVGSGTVSRYVVWGTTITANSEPCQRTDKCFINPSMSGMLGSIAGSDVLGTCTDVGFVVSPWHNFEYREITGFTAGSWSTTGTPGSWTTVPLASVSGAPTTYGTIGNWEVRTLPSATFISGHVYEFRYQNYRQVSTTPAQYCTGGWSLPQRYMFY